MKTNVRSSEFEGGDWWIHICIETEICIETGNGKSELKSVLDTIFSFRYRFNKKSLELTVKLAVRSSEFEGGGSRIQICIETGLGSSIANQKQNTVAEAVLDTFSVPLSLYGKHSN